MEASQPQRTALEAGDSSLNECKMWVRPAVTRLAAGSAEDGANNIPDGGQPS